MQQFSCFLYSNALVYNRGKYLAFSSHLFAQKPIIWCLLMQQNRLQSGSEQDKSIIKDTTEKEDTPTENIPDGH